MIIFLPRDSRPEPESRSIAMRAEGYQECTRCVMDTTDPEITFNEAGECCHCTEFIDKRAKHTYQGKRSDEQLNALLDRIARSGRGKAYDCVIGVSGGADSSYLAYVIKERGLRPLAVHMDNGWNSDMAVVNIKNITRRMGIDYESYVLDWDEFKDLQLSFLRASVPEAETPTDVAIPAALHRVAAKHNLKYVLSGCNLATEGILPKTWHYDVRDVRYLKAIHSKYGSKSLKKFPTFGFKKEMFYKLIRGMRMVYPLNHIPFVKKDAVRFLESEFDWKPYGGKHHESRYTKFIQSYYLYEKFGIDYRRPGLSIQICTNQIQREDATQRLKNRPYDTEQIKDDKQYISKKLGVSTDEFENILKLPPKWYWDYPNDEKKLALIYDTYRKLFRKEKLDRF